MIGYNIDTLNHEELRTLAHDLQRLCEYYATRMLNKAEVAEKAGMTISWLNNSMCNKAVRLRQAGIRYGTSPNAPIRYPLAEVVAICLERK